MGSAYHINERVHRTRQIALLLSQEDRATALAYAAELEASSSARADLIRTDVSGKMSAG